MKRFLIPAAAALLSLFVVGTFLHAEDAPRAPRGVRRAARRAAREAETRTAAPVGLSDGLTSAGRHALPTPRLAVQKPVFDQSEIIVFTSNADPPAPCRPVNLRDDLFPATSESNQFVAAGNIIQSQEFLPPLPPRDARKESAGFVQLELKPDVAAAAPASRPILQDASATGDVLSRVVVAGELAGLVLPEPGRLDPSVLQASFNQLPVAVSGAVAFAEEAPPPLPPREKITTPDTGANPGDESGNGSEMSYVQCRSIDGPSEEEARVWEALNQPVSLRFEQARLDEVFRHIANSRGINIVIDDTGLAEVGVTSRDPVSIHVERVTLRSALKQILDARDLAWLVQDEVLKITSRQRGEGELFTQVYPVADLIRPISPSGSAVSEGQEPAASTATEEPDFDFVTTLIRTFVQPDSWNESGGPAALVPHAGSRSLVVRQTRRGHEEIVVLLGCVRQIINDVESSDTEGESSSPENRIRHTSWEISDESTGKDDVEQDVAPGVLTIHPQTAAPLKQPCSVHFDGAPLQDVLRHLADHYGLSIHVDIAGLAAGGATPETPVSVHVDGIQITSALNLILMPLNLEFEYRDGIVSITGRDRQEGELTTRVYAAADLVCPSMRYLQQDVSTQVIRQPLNANALIELITCALDPSGWEEFGGQGHIVCHEPTLSLVVHQTPRVHQEIADLLIQLRQLREVEISLELSAIRISSDDLARIKTEWGADWYGNRVDASPEQIKRLTSLLDGADQTTVVRPGRITMYEGQSWRVAAAEESDSPFAYVTAISSAGRRSVDCNIAVPRTIDGKQMLQRVTVFTTAVGNTCVINASEPSPVIDDIPFGAGGFARFGNIRELSPGEGDGVTWDESSDGVTLVFITPRIIVREEEEERLLPAGETSESGVEVEKESPPIITVTPRIIIQEEEELLGIPLDPPSTGPRPDQSVQPPPAWDVFGIPTHDLLFREEEPEQRLILQTP